MLNENTSTDMSHKMDMWSVLLTTNHQQWSEYDLHTLTSLYKTLAFDWWSLYEQLLKPVDGRFSVRMMTVFTGGSAGS